MATNQPRRYLPVLNLGWRLPAFPQVGLVLCKRSSLLEHRLHRRQLHGRRVLALWLLAPHEAGRYFRVSSLTVGTRWVRQR